MNISLRRESPAAAAAAPAAATTGPTPSRTGLVPVLALGTFAVGTDAFVVAGFLPDLAADLGVSTAAAGQAVTAFAAAYALLSPVLATLTARVPRRTLLVAALTGLGVANLATALAPTFAALIVARVAAAGAAAAFTPNAGAVAAFLTGPERRARALAVVVGGLTVATALGVPLGDVAGELTGWRWALAAVAALALLTAAALALLLPALPGNPAVPLRERLAVLRRPAVRAVLPLTVLGMTAAYTVYAYSVPVLAAVGVGESDTAWVLSLYGLGAVLGNLASGYATDRFGPVRVLSTGYLVLAAGLGGLGLLAASGTRAPALVGLLAVAWGAGSWCQTPPQQHRLIAAAPQGAPLVVALNSSAIYAGIGSGTVLGGLTAHAGAATMYATAAALAAVAAACLFATVGRTR